MHNRPTNNETDIIRNIFSKSLNEETMEELRKSREKYLKYVRDAVRDADYQTSREAVDRLNQQPTPPAPLAVGQRRPEHLRRLMQDPRNLPYLLRTGQAKISYQNPPAPEPDESGVVNRTYFVPQGVDPSTVNPDKPIRLPTDTAINLARQRIENQTDVRFSEPSAGYTRPSNLVGIPQQPSLFDMGMQQPAKPKTSEFELGPITSTTPYQTANSLIQQMKDIGLFGDQEKTEPNVQSTTSPYETPPELTAPRVAKPITQPKMSEKEGKEKVLSTIRQITAPESQPAVTQPQATPQPRTVPTVTRVLPPSQTGGVDRGYQNVPARTTQTSEGQRVTDEDLTRIVPGSQSWSQLTPTEQQRVKNMYASGKVGSSLNIRFKGGKFDEPGYGEEGSKGDIVKALNAVKVLAPASPKQATRDVVSGSAPSPSSQTTTGRGTAPSPIPKPVTPADVAAYMETRAVLDAAAIARGEMPPSAAGRGWTPETWAAADRQSAELRRRLNATAEPTATSQPARPTATSQPARSPQDVIRAMELKSLEDWKRRADITDIADPRQRQAAMDRYRAEQRIRVQGGLPLPPGPYSRPSYTPLNEYYYNTLSEKLDLLEQEEIKGLNIGAYKSRKKAYRTAARLVNPFYTGASGDSSSSGKLESSADNSGSDVKQPSWGERLKPHIITLMGAAQDHKIELSKEKAVSNSSDRRRLLAKYKPGSDVHKAAQAVDEIMKQFKRAR